MNFSGWKRYNLDEVYEFSSGLSKNRQEFGFGYPFVTFKDVFYNYFIPNQLGELANTTEKERVRCSVKRGDVFLTRTSETMDELGKSSVALKDYAEATFNGFTKRLRPNGKVNVYPEYAGYYFRSPRFRAEINSMATMTTRASLNNEMMARLKITVPDLVEQKNIAKILLSIDEKIEINNKINKKLEEMAQAIFKQWFVDFEFPNEEGNPYKSSGGEMVESELGIFPKGWKVKSLGELCEIITKSEKPFENPEKTYEHFSLPACDEGKLPVIEMGENISSNKYKISNDCILISKLNPSTKRIWDPLCNSENAICSTEFIVFKPYDTNIKPFCYEVINCDRFTDFLLANVTGSTGSRQRVQPKNTLNFKVLVAETNLIEAFCSVIKSIHQKIKLNIQEGKMLKDIRDTLLPKLMSGEIRVQIENDLD